MIYMLDTDAVIFLARGSKSTRPRQQRERARLLASRCQKAQLEGDIVGLSAITISELEYGARYRYGGHYETEISLIRRLTGPFERFDFDALSCPERYGQARHDLEQRGKTIGAFDLLIAAHALALHATLVTNNIAHFSRVAGLSTENWLAS